MYNALLPMAEYVHKKLLSAFFKLFWMDMYIRVIPIAEYVYQKLSWPLFENVLDGNVHFIDTNS